MINNAYAQTAAAPAMGLMDFAFPLLLFGILFFVMILPQMKRQKQHRQMVETLAKGDEIVTGGGVLGRVSDVGANFLTLEIAKGVEVRVQKHVVAAVMPKGTIKSLEK